MALFEDESLFTDESRSFDSMDDEEHVPLNSNIADAVVNAIKHRDRKRLDSYIRAGYNDWSRLLLKAVKYGDLYLTVLFSSKIRDQAILNRALLSASRRGHDHIIKYLHGKGADALADALCMGVKHRRLEAIVMLLTLVSPDEIIDAAILAVEEDQSYILKLLLAYKPDPLDTDKYTELMLTAMSNHRDRIVDYLSDFKIFTLCGARLNELLIASIKYGYPRVTFNSVSYGADDAAGALKASIRNDNSKLTGIFLKRLLVRKDVDLAEPLFLAVRKGHSKLAKNMVHIITGKGRCTYLLSSLEHYQVKRSRRKYLYRCIKMVKDSMAKDDHRAQDKISDSDW